MLVKGLVERFSGGYSLRQSGVRHKTHAARRLPHRTRLAPRATRHADVALMSQLPNNAITDWFGRVSCRRGCGDVLMCGGASVCWFSRTQKCVTLSTSEA